MADAVEAAWQHMQEKAPANGAKSERGIGKERFQIG
jgi:hypothetical protein